MLAVLAGTSLRDAAAEVAKDPAGLADAVALYQAAGRAALDSHAQAAARWHQVSVEFPGWDTAEHTAATRLEPLLQQAEAAETITAWWFTRKAPCWRLRCQPAPDAARTDLAAFLSPEFGTLLGQGLIASTREVIYESEACAFGGHDGMEIAHRLFHADSRNILRYLDPGHLAPAGSRTPGRRELSVLLCATLMRGAGQDWYEQGDIWDQVAASRPAPSGMPM